VKLIEIVFFRAEDFSPDFQPALQTGGQSFGIFEAELLNFLGRKALYVGRGVAGVEAVGLKEEDFAVEVLVERGW
jgi:hypothetical protein